MRGALVLVGVGLLSLAVLPAAGSAKDEVPKVRPYKVEVVKDPRTGKDRLSYEIRDGARRVTVELLIRRTSDDGVVADVPKEELVVTEDDKEVEVLELVRPTVEKLTVVLAIDVSGSMERGDKMPAARGAAEHFLNKLDPGLDVGLLLFDHRVPKAGDGLSATRRRDLARDRARLEAHREEVRGLVRKAKPDGGTAYLDATSEAVAMLRGVPGRKAVVLMTDGVDMNSVKGLAQVIGEAKAAGVNVYTVGIGAPGKNDPVTTILVLDHSGSMAVKADPSDDLTKMDAAKRAAKRFVDMMRVNARTTLLPFSSQAENPEGFTSDKDDVKRRIQRLKPEGGTLLYTSTYYGLMTLVAARPGGKKPRGKEAVVVLTDGQDESPGSLHPPEEVIKEARKAEVPLYMLGLGKEADISEAVMKRMAKDTKGKFFRAGREDELLKVFEDLSIDLHDDGIDEESLRELAAKTGGSYTHVSEMSKLELAYGKLADEFNPYYKVTFKSRRPSHDGTARGLDFEVRGLSNKARADDQARGVLVPQMSGGVYFVALAALLGLLAVPAGLRRLARASGA